MTIRNLGDLLRVLQAYEPHLPVEFTSSESGGYWPDGRAPMDVTVDEQVRHVKEAGGEEYLEVALLLRDRADG